MAIDKRANQQGFNKAATVTAGRQINFSIRTTPPTLALYAKVGDGGVLRVLMTDSEGTDRYFIYVGPFTVEWDLTPGRLKGQSND